MFENKVIVVWKGIDWIVIGKCCECGILICLLVKFG